MYFTDDSLLPENMPSLMITAAPYGPMWMPEDCTPEQKLPVTWDEQVQAAVDCYNAGATLLHIHVRDPKTGHISKDFQQYNDQVARLRKAVPKMILQMGGSISFAPAPGEEAHAANYDTRHKLCTIKPAPDQITVMCGSPTASSRGRPVAARRGSSTVSPLVGSRASISKPLRATAARPSARSVRSRRNGCSSRAYWPRST